MEDTDYAKGFEAGHDLGYRLGFVHALEQVWEACQENLPVGSDRAVISVSALEETINNLRNG